MLIYLLAGKHLLHVIAAKISCMFHMYPFVLICKLFLHPSSTNFMIYEVLMDDGMSRSIAHVQLVGYINESNLSS
jgi:hypothetical protein